MIPYKTILHINRAGKQPVFIQLTNQFITLIKQGTLPPKTKLPSSRTLCDLIGVHRKTIVATYEELILQGWIITVPKKGTYVIEDIPILQVQKSSNSLPKKPLTSGFSFKNDSLLDNNLPQHRERDFRYIDDGVSDERLAPVKELATRYRKVAYKHNTISHMGYCTTYGNRQLREVLVNYLNETRGLNIALDNILITRGSQMGIFLATQLLMETSGYVVVGETNYSAADVTFQYANAKLLRVQVDEDGLDTAHIEELVQTYNVKAVYTTSHHHHPTTVTLSASRRMHLLNLSRIHDFAILEDDYDYDFHYNHAPILPLASHDANASVIYVGSVCKTVAPVYRVGYLVAAKDFVDECAKLRRYVDRQGDAILELTFANFIKDGSLDRHINKVMKIYKDRRDFFCELLKKELHEFLSFEVPKGGMAIWVTLNKAYSWQQLKIVALKHKLVIPDYNRYDKAGLNHNAIRIGFARQNHLEAKDMVLRLKAALTEFKAI